MAMQTIYVDPRIRSKETRNTIATPFIIDAKLLQLVDQEGMQRKGIPKTDFSLPFVFYMWRQLVIGAG
jgi:hypothetical protein